MNFRSSSFSRLFPLFRPFGHLFPRGEKGKICGAFAPEFYKSGFRVEPAMTKHFFDDGIFFASPGVASTTRRKNKGE
jgi:hypothetical protein